MRDRLWLKCRVRAKGRAGQGALVDDIPCRAKELELCSWVMDGESQFV